MSLENEYFHLKEGLKAEKEKLAKAEAIEIVEDNSNPFTVEERLEAKNKSIKMSNEIIKELEEMFEEVKNELKEFINNGGEVSEITRNEFKETDNDFEEININFKIISNKNENVYCEGYVTINDEEAEDVDWYYWTGKGYQSRPFYHHNEEEITGLTDIQNNEIDTFIADYSNDALWIDTCILQSNRDENRSYVRENCTLIINEGAKMECEIKEIDPFFNKGDYVVEVIPFFNGERIDAIATYMVEYYEEFDPWNVGDDSSYIEDGHIFFEMSKDYWDDDCKEERLAEVNEECRRIYARSLTRELGIYAKYGETMEQLMDGDYDNEWLFQMTQLVNKSDELDAFLREEGYIDDELDY